MRTLIRAGTIVTMDGTRRILGDGGVLVHDGVIERVLTGEELAGGSGPIDETVDAHALTLIPGFVQTHIHLCQTLFRGLADDLELMDWLKKRIFPLEAAHTASSMHASALLGIGELVRSGTTTIMDMGSIHHQEEIVRAIEESGLRACLGKSLIDTNTIYPPLQEPAAQALADARRQCELWHLAAGGRIRYAVAPRFVLSCSEQLLRESYALARSTPGVLFHTHAAENRKEMQAVRARCRMENIQYLDSIGVLGEASCLAHCVWISEPEVMLLAERRSAVLHCPGSNLKLGSGIARIPQLLKRGVRVSLGTDGAACNNSLDMFREMRLAALIQKPTYGPLAMDARTVFELATRGGAETLGLLSETGSIEQGKRADLVLLDLGAIADTPGATRLGDVFSTIVYAASPEHVHSTMVDGRWLYRDRAFTRMDQDHVVRTASLERQALVTRARL